MPHPHRCFFLSLSLSHSLISTLFNGVGFLCICDVTSERSSPYCDRRPTPRNIRRSLFTEYNNATSTLFSETSIHPSHVQTVLGFHTSKMMSCKNMSLHTLIRPIRAETLSSWLRIRIVAWSLCAFILFVLLCV
jgi:hypothetical protein